MGLLLAAALLAACHSEGTSDASPDEAPGPPVRDSRSHMDTIFEITLLAENRGEAAAHRAIDLAFERVEHVERVMSAFRADSQIARINASAGGSPVPVEPELAGLVQRALTLCDETGGLLDITFRPLGLVWDFRAQPFSIPSPEAVAHARDLVDCHAIEIDRHASTLRLTRPGMSMALGALAKGYAIDLASAAMAAEGYENSLVNGGGDVMARGSRGDGPWRVGIQHPREPRGTLLGRVNLQDRALVTSGDYERFIEVDGQRLHHILDPRTGWPSQGVASVSVLAPNAELADALATAFFIGGPEGLAAIQAYHPEVELFMVKSDGEYLLSQGFIDRLEPAPFATSP